MGLTSEEIKEAGNRLKNDLSIEQIYDLTSELGGEPMPPSHNRFVCRTICHNENNGSYKLYYYDNTKLFHCYTDCGSMDIFELVKKVKERETNQEWGILKCINFVAKYHGYKLFFDNENESYEEILDDWKVLKRIANNKVSSKRKEEIKLNTFSNTILSRLPHPRILPWEKDGISKEVISNRGIAFDPIEQGIVIPHYDINNNLVGIRERTLIKDLEVNGKYKPAILNKVMYNHPLGYNLYGIEVAKNPIKILGKAIACESEKGSMQYGSYFGEENNICVACCGSSLSSYQVNLLLSLGVKEICIAFDKQFKNIGDEEWSKWTEKLKKIHSKYCNLVTISFIFDNGGNLLPYKASPLDMGGDIFMELYKKRVYL